MFAFFQDDGAATRARLDNPNEVWQSGSYRFAMGVAPPFIVWRVLMVNSLLISWLTDAYTMERTLISALEAQAKDADSGPMAELGIRLRDHAGETLKHADRMEQCLKLLGSTPVWTRGALTGAPHSPVDGLFRDKTVKNVIAAYGAEQFEVAAYRALIAIAEEFGNRDIVLLCEENLHEDAMMATWLEDQIKPVVRQTLSKQTEQAPRS